MGLADEERLWGDPPHTSLGLSYDVRLAVPSPSPSGSTSPVQPGSVRDPDNQPLARDHARDRLTPRAACARGDTPKCLDPPMFSLWM